jgi:nitrite reductase (NO-forming)
MVPAGGSAVLDFRVEVPGTYILVDHSLLRAFNKGAIAQLKVNGDEDKALYSGKEVDEVYMGEAAPAAQEALAKADGESSRHAKGEATFIGVCSNCHQRDAKGLANVFPPLAESDFLKASDESKVIGVVLAGLSGPIKVNGHDYNGTMPAFANLTDHEIADVLTYVRANFGNSGAPVTDQAVAKLRAGLPKPVEGHP